MGLFSRKGQKHPPGRSKAFSHADPGPRVMATGNGPVSADELRVREIGGRLLDLARANRDGVLSARFYQDKLMDWTMRDRGFKVQLFRFVDTFPVLTSPAMVHDILTDYLSQPGVKPPPFVESGLRAGSVAKGLVSSTVSGQIKSMAGNFIAGTDAADALPKLKKLWNAGLAFSVDLLGEACVSDDEADAYRDKYLDLVTNLPKTVASWPSDARLEHDHLGPIPRTNVSVKLTSLSARMTPMDPRGSIRDLMTRLVPILEAAREHGVFINFDMEQAAFKDLTIDAFFQACEAVDFEAGIAMQAYLRSGVDDARRVAEWARSHRRDVTVRLVKGAYWDYETIHAEQMGWPSKVWSVKWETDRCFEQMSEVFLDSTPCKKGEGGVKLALGSHNARSIAAAIAGLERRRLPNEAIELQMLHGMADQLKRAAADATRGMGLRVREYVPVGEMIPGMAYLVRRLLENTSNESWLRAGFHEEASRDELLAPPGPAALAAVTAANTGGAGSNGLNGQHAEAEPRPTALHLVAPERHQLSASDPGVGDGRPFFNEPFRDFSQAAQREAFAAAVESTDLGPAPAEVSAAQASEIVAAAERAFTFWRDVDPVKRAAVLVRAADLMRRQRDKLSAVVLREAGKPWAEADADVCEAIDFLEYYARESVALARRRRIGRFIGELDETWYQPRGVAAVISPWNFPLAICTGMTAAALVTGNTVVVKPAEQTPRIAQMMVDKLNVALREHGAPDNVVQFCPGRGETVGASLVEDPRVAIIAFTGSRPVGLGIVRAAAETHPGQRHVKRVVCEMGGKNAIIVDASADLDEAVLGVRYSAYGYSGQKCSACGRVIIVDPEGPDGAHARAFLDRLAASARSLVVGDPADPGTDVGPVIDDEAHAKITRMIAGAREAHGVRELVSGEPFDLASTRGQPVRCIPPHLFAGVRPEHELAREEVFGPVLAAMHAQSFDEALTLANDHEYKLTGAVFTRKPAHIEKAKAGFRVGNLYINRGCTGALVARMPFGGFGLSGVGSKAGGADYLHHFVDPRACCENTMRRGFAPEL